MGKVAMPGGGRQVSWLCRDEPWLVPGKKPPFLASAAAACRARSLALESVGGRTLSVRTYGAF